VIPYRGLRINRFLRMLNTLRVLALIPARAGSKRLPKKNTLPLLGKPLISWSIESALKSKYIDEVVVSTDSEEIAAISRKLGAIVPFMRPEELAQDASTTNDVLLHCIEFYKSTHNNFDIVVLLQPTSPMRTAQTIDAALQLFLDKNAKGIISVTECEHSPMWANTLPDDQSLEHFIRADVKGKRSQDLPISYRLNGAIYIFDVASLIKEKGIFYSSGVYAFVMDQHQSVDIDTEVDFRYAEFLMEQEHGCDDK